MNIKNIFFSKSDWIDYFLGSDSAHSNERKTEAITAVCPSLIRLSCSNSSQSQITAILRNYDNLLDDEIYMGGHGDVDLICEDSTVFAKSFKRTAS